MSGSDEKGRASSLRVPDLGSAEKHSASACCHLKRSASLAAQSHRNLRRECERDEESREGFRYARLLGAAEERRHAEGEGPACLIVHLEMFTHICREWWVCATQRHRGVAEERQKRIRRVRMPLKLLFALAPLTEVVKGKPCVRAALHGWPCASNDEAVLTHNKTRNKCIATHLQAGRAQHKIHTRPGLRISGPNHAKSRGMRGRTYMQEAFVAHEYVTGQDLEGEGDEADEQR